MRQVYQQAPSSSLRAQLLAATCLVSVRIKYSRYSLAYKMAGYANILRQADIFFQFAAEQIERVARSCQERTFQSGEIVFPEGSSSDELYIIAQGEVEILLDPKLVSDAPGQEILPAPIATLRRGQSFGEIALVDQGVRSATARAAQDDTRLLILPSAELLNLCEEDPVFGYQLMHNLAADLALKIRSTDLLIRAELLYAHKGGL